ncbi:transposase and inactivated derivatives [Corynebacterium glutamicum]|nr:transposase and inactivated derivatives [Corynebacterium glutamicum]
MDSATSPTTSFDASSTPDSSPTKSMHSKNGRADKAPSLARAIAELKSEGICPPTVEHRQVKYLNNILEGDHGRLKRILGPKGAFKNLDICISDVERDGGDALIAERARHDVDLTGNRTRTR